MNRWQVFRRGSYLGVMTAAEIRRALREGVVDPFDLVCREGSQLRVEILEVDEIFTAREDEGQGDGFTQVSPMAMPVAVNMAPNTSYVHHIHHQHFAPSPAPVSSHTPPRAPAYSPYGRRKSQKKFYLIDPNGRMLGPLTAGEIQSLATRGIVGRGVFVQKIGEGRRVSLGSFLNNYARLNARVNRGVDLRSSAALNAVYRGMAARRFKSNSSLLPYLVVTLVGAILGFLVYFALHPQKDSSGRRVKHRVERRVAKRSPAPTLKRVQPKKEKAKAVRSPKPVAAPVKKLAPAQKLEKKIEVVSRHRAQKEVQKPAKATKRAARKEVTKQVPRTSVTPAPVKRTPTPVAARKSTPRPPPAPTPKPIARPQPVAPPPPPKPQELVDGQVATLSGMSYSIAELDECPIKCKMRFSKPGGPTVTAVFFKGAHLDALLAKNGRATISGHIKKQGAEIQIFLESVR